MKRFNSTLTHISFGFRDVHGFGPLMQPGRRRSRLAASSIVLVVGVFLGLVGCSAQDASTPGQQSASEPAGANPAGTNPPGTHQPSTNQPSEGSANPTTGGPPGTDASTSQRGTGIGHSQAAKLSDQQALEEYLTRSAKSLGVVGEVGDVPIVRRIKPEEKVSLLVRCLRDNGFPVIETGTNAFTIDVPAEQQHAAAIAHYECLASYPPQTRYLQPMGTEQYQAIYRYYVQTLVPCLADQGYPQTDPVPTEQTFLDNLGTKSEWTPYLVVSSGSNAQFDALQKACPQQPPSDEIFPPN